MTQKKIDVAILGATGVVGQKAIALLKSSPLFEVKELVASDRRTGQVYGEVVDWREGHCELPSEVAKITLKSFENLTSPFVVSCLPSDMAEIMEPKLAEQGKFIFSNASTFRMQSNVPLLVPEINASHLSLLKNQNTAGKIITNPNCSAVGVTLALAPLKEIGEIMHVSVVTMQSSSGAGYPGVPSLDLMNNTIPHIDSEFEKVTEETKKILGEAGKAATFAVSTHVHRVPVMFGHTATLHVTFKNRVTASEALMAYQKWNQKFPNLFVLHETKGRPQPMRDLKSDDMRAHIGHLRQGDLPNMLGLVVLTHNLVRGAAGAVIANMTAFQQQNL
ncbi:MAG: aspartate-semialdehyde dehydrogenase [Bacteriovoracaceae bacterium]|nr:aspartate-semialdehyde dehydrogenase [Bacteriovoracaceae bacterium]